MADYRPVFACHTCRDTGLCPHCHKARRDRQHCYSERDGLRETVKAILATVNGSDPVVARMCRDGLEGRYPQEVA